MGRKSESSLLRSYTELRTLGPIRVFLGGGGSMKGYLSLYIPIYIFNDLIFYKLSSLYGLEFHNSFFKKCSGLCKYS
jgi:hypothetical protein